ncbi:MAG: sensor histidine kinase [Candidatus Saccharimonadaceae bacterium]
MKLTNHIAIRYIGVATIVLLISVPLFYIILQRIMWHSIDESMQFQKEWTEEQLKTISPEHFVSFNNDIIILPRLFPYKERHYNEDIYIPYDNEMVTYRVLEFNTNVSGTPYAVRIQKSLMESENILQAIAALQISVLLILLLSLTFINKNLRKNVWKPFYKTLDNLRIYRIDREESLNLHSSKIEEIDNLNRSLNDLTKHNKEIFITQKEFTENASHELQTPLATIQSSLDLLWQTSPLSEEQAKLLQNLTETNIRMSKLNKSLLLLTKIDNNQFTDKKEISLNKLTNKIINQNENNFTQKNIHIQKSISSTITVFADETLMETLIENLISNAFRHTPINGYVDLQMSEHTFKIGNTAKEGQPLDKERLFCRFQKQQFNAQNSVGVGLEICRRICIESEFDIYYEFSDKKNWFVVKF